MGLDIERTDYSAQDVQRFEARLDENLKALEQLLIRPGFGEGPRTLGAELEVYIVDAEGFPLPINQQLCALAQDPQLTLELNRYNLEYNLSPTPLAGRPFTALEAQLKRVLARLNRLAESQGGQIVPIGILPTLRQSDFGPENMTDAPRYHALVKQISQLRQGPFRVSISGDDVLEMESEDITLEGANTSLQIHLRVPPDQFADTYNAAQLATPLVVGLAANSPGFLGFRLWQETRIPLFTQSVECRNSSSDTQWRHPTRVQFGQGWLRRGALELFRQTVSLYQPLLPLCSEEQPLQAVRNGQLPSLSELRLQQGSVWLWNRPVYDPTEGGHLRIEMRALAAGPTPVDMAANAALLVGLSEALVPHLERLLPALPFKHAEYNFYRAAQHGMDARLIWPTRPPDATSLPHMEERPLVTIVQELLPAAARGLERLGIERSEIDRLLGVVQARLDARVNGAIWQRRVLERLQAQGCRGYAAQQAMLASYRRQLVDGHPVSSWGVG